MKNGNFTSIFNPVISGITGKNLIEASAGTGKTYSIALIFLRLILEKKVPLKEILVMTFTQAATAELKSRIRSFIKTALEHTEKDGDDENISAIIRNIREFPDFEERFNLLKEAALFFDEAAIFTIHSFCARMLKEFAFESGASYDSEMVKSGLELVESVVDDFWRSEISTGKIRIGEENISKIHESLYNFAYKISGKPLLEIYPENETTDNLQSLIFTELFTYLRKNLPKKKEELGVETFDDLLTSLYKGLNSADGIKLKEAIGKKYRAALIDEFQDTDTLQYAVFSTIFGDKEKMLFLIGDPKQSIYAFRGADIFSYIKASNEAEQKFTLGTNFRSHSRLVEAFNIVFGTENPFVFNEIAYNNVISAGKKDKEILIIEEREAPPFVIWNSYEPKGMAKTNASKMITEAVSEEITRLLNKSVAGTAYFGTKEKPLKASDIAILVNSGYEGEEIKKALEKKGVPSSSSTSENVFASSVAKELFQIMFAMANPSEEKVIRAALITSSIGKTIDELNEISENEKGREELLTLFKKLNKLWKDSSFISSCAELMRNFSIKKRLLSMENGERKLTNFLHLIELLHSDSLENFFSPEELLSHFEKKIIHADERVEEYEQRLDKDDEVVTIITIHKSKGLQYPVVFVPFLFRGGESKELWRTIHEETKEYLVLEKDKFKEKSEAEATAEAMRLFYVALTRAEQRLYTGWGNFYSGLARIPFSTSSGERFFGNLQRFQQFPELFEIKSYPTLSGEKFDNQTNSCKLISQEFKGFIDKKWGIASYSSLTAHSESTAELPDYDAEEGEIIEKETYPMLPKGEKTGSMLHEILEKIDYISPDKKIFSETISKYYATSQQTENFEKGTFQIIEKTLVSPLFDDGFSLSMLEKSKRINEMEFYFPVDKINSATIDNYFIKCRKRLFPEISEKVLSPNLRRNELAGFFHGFIDIIFGYKDNFFIADWKSNSLSDYSDDSLKKAIIKHNYDIQYMVYAVALKRYLFSRGCDFSFGGVFYFFLRGIEPAEFRKGMFFVKPETSEIEEFEGLFFS